MRGGLFRSGFAAIRSSPEHVSKAIVAQFQSIDRC
jgi:hypothetical protein